MEKHDMLLITRPGAQWVSTPLEWLQTRYNIASVQSFVEHFKQKLNAVGYD